MAIITPEQAEKLSREESDTATSYTESDLTSSTDSYHPPPAYDDATTHQPQNANASPPPFPPPPPTHPIQPVPPPARQHPPNIAPTNYLILNETNRGIKQAFAINPSIEIPGHPASPNRANLVLDSRNGSVSTDVYLVSQQTYGNQAVLRLSSANGSVKATIHRRSVQSSPFKLTATSQNGSVNLYLPRDFCGPISAHTHRGSVKLSEGMSGLAMNLGSAPSGGYKYFVGDYSRNQADKESIDEVVAESQNGSIRLYFEDEDVSVAEGTGNFFSKMFGR